jgi:biopolymer transport protein ExbD
MFFIVAGQMQNRALPDLPGTVAEDASNRTEADLVVLASGDWQVAGRTVDAETLARHLPAATKSPSLNIGAAAGTTMSELETLLGLLAAGGYRDVVLLTEPSGR